MRPPAEPEMMVFMMASENPPWPPAAPFSSRETIASSDPTYALVLLYYKSTVRRPFCISVFSKIHTINLISNLKKKQIGLKHCILPYNIIQFGYD